MLYYSNFKDINNKNYKVRITTNGSTNQSKEITLGTPAFTVEVETGDSNLYKPIKGQTATVKLVTNDYLFDLYSSAAQQSKVELLDNNNNLIWGGYITPNLYQQGYENDIEEIEVEATDAISTLQYFPYTPVGSTKDIVSFWSILNHIIKKCGVYTSFYFSNAMTEPNISASRPLIESAYISEQNFFDEDDEAMMMRDVLKEVCKYFSVTCIAVGDSVFFIDYDALKAGHNTYYKYNIDSSAYTTVTVSSSLDISGNDYSENGGTLTLGETYNKVILTDSLYSYSSILPSIWEVKDLENYGGSWNYTQTLTEELVIEDNKANDQYKCYLRYYKNKNFKSYYYNKNLTFITNNPTSVDYAYTQNYVGATICRASFKKVEEDDNGELNDIAFTDYLLLHNHDTNPARNTGDSTITLATDTGKPLFEMEVDVSKPSFMGGGNTWLIIQGNFIYMDREGAMFVPTEYENKDDDFHASALWIKAKFQYGNKYWNGITWQATECCFKLPFYNNKQTDHHINQRFPIKNTIGWTMGLDNEGYGIPTPSSQLITGKPKFTLYQPHRIDNNYRCDAVWLSNFDIIAEVQNFEKEDERSTDTEYSNVINEEWVNEFSCEDFKICTWDNKETNYSSVALKSQYDDTYFTYLDTVYHIMNGEYLRPEEHHIWKHVTQFSKPAAELELNLKVGIEPYSTLTDKWLPDRTFVVDSQTIDFENNQTNIKIIEKI